MLDVFCSIVIAVFIHGQSREALCPKEGRCRESIMYFQRCTRELSVAHACFIYAAMLLLGSSRAFGRIRVFAGVANNEVAVVMIIWRNTATRRIAKVQVEINCMVCS